MAGLLADALDDLGGHHPVLGDVGATPRAAGVVHAHRDRVRDERDVPATSGVLGQVGEGGEGRVDHGLDEPRVVEVVPQPVDPGRVGNLGDGGREVLAVLATAAVGGVGAGQHGGDAGDAVGLHLLEGLAQVGVPVAVAPVDGHLDAVGREVVLDRRDQLPVLVVDRAASAEDEVVLADLLEPLVRDVPAGGDVAQERDDVVRLLGSAEGDEQERVVRLGVTHGTSLGGGSRDGAGTEPTGGSP